MHRPGRITSSQRPGQESFRPPGGAGSIAACSRLFSSKMADTRLGQLATVFCLVRGNHRHQTPRKDDFPINVHGINCKAEPKFKWPSWVIYDHSYWQDAAENNKTTGQK